MPPKSRKRKALANNDNDNELTPPDRNTWPGWVEMESEPAFFNVMLQDMGVHGVKIHEVWSLDDTELAILPQPVHALIFLFRYRETDKDDLEVECPDHVWYAEQVPDFACATVALLNIVNNIPGLEMGKDLRAFKDFTQDMTPRLRGDAIDGFTFAKRIHNSFARESDLLQADMHMKDKAEKARKYQATAKARKTKAEKAARANKKSSSSPAPATPAGKRTSGRSRKSTANVESETSPKVTPQSPRPSTAKMSPNVSTKIEEPTNEHLNGEQTPSKRSKSPSTTSSKTSESKTPPKSVSSVEPTGKDIKMDEPKKSSSPVNVSTSPEEVNIDTPKKSKSPDSAPSKTNGTAKASDDRLSSSTNITSSPRDKPNTSKNLKLNAPDTNLKTDPNADFTATTERTDSATKPRRSGRQPKPRKDLHPTPETNGSAAEDEEGFHFCAYMPIGSRVWKLDGMDRFPQDMGPIEPGSNWLSIAQPALQSRMAQYAAGAIEFNLMAVVHDPMVACVEHLAANIKALQAVEAKLATVAEDWREMLGVDEKAADVTKVVDHAFGMTNVDVERAELTPEDTKNIADAEDLMQLLDLRMELVLQQGGLRRACRDEMESVQSDARKASARRHDYTEFAREWVGALAEQEVLGALLEAGG